MAIKKRPVSPRQKMINLMYVVLMAMLALNVSTEVLDGFSVVGESLKRTTVSASQENQVIYDAFDSQITFHRSVIGERDQSVDTVAESALSTAGSA